MKNFGTKDFDAKNFATKNLKYLLLTLSILASSSILSMRAPKPIAENVVAPEPIQENDWHFNTDTLKNISLTRQQLVEQDHFHAIDIPIIQENNSQISKEQLKLEATEKYNAFLAELNTAINNPATPAEEKTQAQQLLAQISSMPQEQAIQMLMDQTKGENATKKIKCLFLERPNARATIIFIPGFSAQKENFAPFVKIAPTDCNLLFLELSNQGENGSTIKLLWNANKFGLTEHLEVIEAIKYINQKMPETPIVLLGFCSGAFTAARALIELRGDSTAGSDQDEIKKLNIKGLIFDSGFSSIKDVLPNVTDYIIKEKLSCLAPSGANAPVNNTNNADNSGGGCCGCGCPSFLGTALDYIKSWIPDCIKNCIPDPAPFIKFCSWICNFIKSGTEGTIRLLLNTTRDSLIKPAIVAKDGETNIKDKITKIADIPTFFIHSKGDLFTPIAGAEELHNTIKAASPIKNDNFWNDNFWKTEGYHHATLHLNFKHIYQAKLTKWLADILGPQIPAPANPQTPAEPAGPAAQNPQATDNNGQAEKKLHKDIQDLIEIIDQMIARIETQKQISQSQKPEAEKQQEIKKIGQELIALVQKFCKLLAQTPVIPEKSKAEIITKLKKLNDTQIPDEQIAILKEIRNMLLNISPENTANQQNPTGAGPDGQNNTDQDHERDKNRHKHNPGYYTNPDNSNANPQQSANNPNTNSNSPSNSGHSSLPGNSGPSSSGYRNPGYGSSGNHGSRPYYPSGGTGGGFGGGDWPSGSSCPNNQKDTDKEKPNLTQNEYEYLIDQDYDQDPEMRDRPDRRYWFPRRG